MKILTFGLAALLVSGAVLARAADRPAELRDIQRLQQDLENLDEDLQSLDARAAPQARELRERADDIRDQATYLKVKIKRHQGDEGTGVTLAEVDELRHQVRDLRSDIGSRTASTSSREVRVPAGTEISLRLEQAVSSATAKVEDQVRASVLRPVRIADRVAIPAGTEVRGIVREAEAAERLRHAGRLQLEFDTLYVDHSRQDLHTRVVSLEQDEATGETARKAGIGAVIGGVVGGLLKGRTGVVIGAVAGGGVVMAQKGEDVELPEGTVLKVRLEKPVSVSASSVVRGGGEGDYYNRDEKRD